MKATFFKTTISLIAVIALAISAVGQGKQPWEDPKYGKDSAERVECAKNISLYSEFYKQQNFKDAVKPWREVYRHCPQASKNTFIKGATIYKNLIALEKNDANKDKLIDTLLMVYDKRIEVFGDRGPVLSYKGADLYGYKGDASAELVYPMLKEAMQLEGQESKAAVVTIYMQTAVALYKTSKIEGAEVIEAYTFSMETLDKTTLFNKNIVSSGSRDADKATKELENIVTSVSNVEALFSESGAATCDALIAIFEVKCAENNGNIDWLKKVTKLLNKSDCTEAPLFARASEKLYSLEPSAEAAHNLARLFLKTQQYPKADNYYDEATRLEQDPITKALYLYEWSTLAMAMENYPKVRELSLEALKLNPADGRPYIMIGKAYAATKGIGEQPIEKNSVFWLAVDNFIKAKQVDTALVEQANELIATYSQYFPKNEDWFMQVGTKEGDSYTVGGWINITTKVRF
jgi:tetratricopeptide (TPR) repeat protein